MNEQFIDSQTDIFFCMPHSGIQKALLVRLPRNILVNCSVNELAKVGLYEFIVMPLVPCNLSLQEKSHIETHNR